MSEGAGLMAPTKVDGSAVKNNWRAMLARVRSGERMLLTHYGRPAGVALVPAAELERYLAEREKKLRQEYANEGGEG